MGRTGCWGNLVHGGKSSKRERRNAVLLNVNFRHEPIMIDTPPYAILSLWAQP